MKWLSRILATAQFELKRSMTIQRLSAFAVLSIFPPAMTMLIMYGPGLETGEPVVLLLTYMVLILSLMLWATPNVYSELENRSWTFVTARPGGRISVLLGKWLASTVSSMIVCIVAISLCMIAIQGQAGFENPLRTWGIFILLSCVACNVYASIFSLIGVLFQRRAMIFAAGYTLVSELLLASVPALVSKFTMRYHLLGLTDKLLGWFLPGERLDDETLNMFISSWPQWAHWAVLLIVPVFVLSIAAYVIRYREYITTAEA